MMSFECGSSQSFLVCRGVFVFFLFFLFRRWGVCLFFGGVWVCRGVLLIFSRFFLGRCWSQLMGRRDPGGSGSGEGDVLVFSFFS